MRSLTALLMVLTGALILNCAHSRVKSEYSSKVDFSRYRTYAWIEQPEKPFGYLTTTLDRKKITESIKKAVDDELNTKGYKRVERDPDFFVAYYTNVRERIDTARLGYNYITDTYLGEHIEVRAYKQGSLVLDCVDGKSKALVWRGLAEGAVRNADKIETQIRATVETILDRFPPERSGGSAQP